MRYARHDDHYFSSHDGASWTRLDVQGREDVSIGDLIDAVNSKKCRTTDESVLLPEEVLQCPVVRPSKIVAVGLNYRDHVAELGIEAPPRPNLFAKFPSSLNAPYGDIVMERSLSEQLDYEAELAVVISKRARRIKALDASEYIFGMCISNDISARDLQVEDVQVCRAKSMDSFCPIGPYVTGIEDIADPGRLEIRSWVNGDLRQSSNTGELIFDVARLIEFITQGITLEVGDVILTGTPAGVGFTKTPPQFLRAGDTVRCEVAGLGFIENKVTDAGASPTEGGIA